MRKIDLDSGVLREDSPGELGQRHFRYLARAGVIVYAVTVDKADPGGSAGSSCRR